MKALALSLTLAGARASPAWAPLPAMPSARMGHSGGQNGTHVFVVGGYDGVSNLASALAFDARARAWSRLPALPFARSDLGAAALAGVLYAVGGEAALPGCPSNPGLGVCNVSR